MGAVERVGEPDLPDLLPLMRAYCDFYRVDPTDERLLALSRALIADPEHEGMQLIARGYDGAGVGFATLFWTWSTTAAARIGTMNDLFVADAARGGGIADALIEACRGECRRRGAVRIEWQTAPDNLRAQAVYERIGATREKWVDYRLDT